MVGLFADLDDLLCSGLAVASRKRYRHFTVRRLVLERSLVRRLTTSDKQNTAHWKSERHAIRRTGGQDRTEQPSELSPVREEKGGDVRHVGRHITARKLEAAVCSEPTNCRAQPCAVESAE